MSEIHPQSPFHNYMSAVLDLWDSGQVPRGELSQVDILHDDWCDYPNLYCNCKPIVKLRIDPEKN